MHPVQQYCTGTATQDEVNNAFWCRQTLGLDATKAKYLHEVPGPSRTPFQPQ